MLRSSRSDQDQTSKSAVVIRQNPAGSRHTFDERDLSLELFEVDRRNLVGFKLTKDLFHSRRLLDFLVIVSLLRLEPGNRTASSVFAVELESDVWHSHFEVWKLKLANLGRPVLKDARRLAQKLLLLSECALELGLYRRKRLHQPRHREGCALNNAPRPS